MWPRRLLAVDKAALAANANLYVPVIAYCIFDLIGCKLPSASNYLPNAMTADNSLCQYAGCNDIEAYNYDSLVRAAPIASSNARVLMQPIGQGLPG